MRRLAISLVVLAFSSASWAIGPQAGQRVVIRHQVYVAGELNKESTVKRTVVQFDQRERSFLVDAAVATARGEFHDPVWVDLDEMNLEYVGNTQAFCESITEYPRTLETVETPAGVFVACRVEKSVGDRSQLVSWYSDQVPFGKVKSLATSADGTTTRLDLIEFAP